MYGSGVCAVLLMTIVWIAGSTAKSVTYYTASQFGLGLNLGKVYPTSHLCLSPISAPASLLSRGSMIERLRMCCSSDQASLFANDGVLVLITGRLLLWPVPRCLDKSRQ